MTQLYKAVACGDSGFLASQREWLLTEDPDLDVLRGQNAFFDLEVATYGSVRASERRGPQLVAWQVRTFTTALVLHVATSMSAEWERRDRDGETVDPNDRTVDSWFGLECAAWGVVDELCFEHRDSAQRHEAVTEWRKHAPKVAPPLDVTHPTFSRRRLGRQVAALRDPGSEPTLRTDLAGQIEFVIHQSSVRFAAVVDALHTGDTCCSRSSKFIPRDDETALTDFLRATVAERRNTPVQGWIQRSRGRWQKAVSLFDDGAAPATKLGQRWQDFATEFPR